MYTMFRFALLATFALALPVAHAQTPDADRDAFIVERTLWVKPNRTTQFASLYQRVEIARLEALRKEGKVLWYRVVRPMLAEENDAWDVRVTIAWRDAASATGESRARLSRSGASAPTERALMDELVIDQRETWVQETTLPAG